MVQPQLEIVSTTWHGLDAVELHDDGTVLATIALRGATPLSWRPTAGELSWEALDGYLDAEDLLAQSGVRGGIMAPFCNRITDARYTFAGTEHDLRPGMQDRLIYHGLVREMDFTLSSAQVRDGAAHLVLDCRELGRGGTPGYPFPVDVQVTYAISRTGLAISVSGTNTGPSAAPFAMGWHPYLAFPARQVDALELHVPAASRVLTDSDLIPLPGEAAFQPIEDGDPLDFRRPRLIGETVFDACWTDVEPDEDGVVRSQVREPASGATLTLWQERGHVHGFTGDTLDRAPRTSLALEPVETVTNAFNRPDQAATLLLEPGEQRVFTFGLVASHS
ncbi:aldose epimerase family protein [Salana multivorans]